MRLPLQISFRHLATCAALEARIRVLAARLGRFSDQIMSCHVTVLARHQHPDQLYEVEVGRKLPHGQLVAGREQRGRPGHEDVCVALRDAFRAVRRRLEDYERGRRQDVKRHEPPPHGLVVGVYPAEDVGRIQSHDGRSIYLHRHSMLGEGFEHLTTGAAVRCVEQPGDRGRQASAVHFESRGAPRL